MHKVVDALNGLNHQKFRSKRMTLTLRPSKFFPKIDQPNVLVYCCTSNLLGSAPHQYGSQMCVPTCGILVYKIKL